MDWEAAEEACYAQMREDAVSLLVPLDLVEEYVGERMALQRALVKECFEARDETQALVRQFARRCSEISIRYSALNLKEILCNLEIDEVMRTHGGKQLGEMFHDMAKSRD